MGVLTSVPVALVIKRAGYTHITLLLRLPLFLAFYPPVRTVQGYPVVTRVAGWSPGSPSDIISSPDPVSASALGPCPRNLLYPVTLHQVLLVLLRHATPRSARGARGVTVLRRPQVADLRCCVHVFLAASACRVVPRTVHWPLLSCFFSLRCPYALPPRLFREEAGGFICSAATVLLMCPMLICDMFTASPTPPSRCHLLTVA